MTENAVRCPACNSDLTTVLQRVPHKQLVDLYQRALNFDVARLVREDIFFVHCETCDLRFFDPAVSGDQSFYTRLQDSFDWYYTDEKYEFDYAAPYVAPGAQVLEIGAGRGAFALKISDANYTGLEFSKTAIEAARVQSINLLAETVEKHATENGGRYDVVCGFQVLEHVVDIVGFVRAACDCLRPGGRLIFSVPSEDSYMGVQVNAALNMPPHHLSRWSDSALQNICKSFPLRMVDLHHVPLADMHWDAYVVAVVYAGMIKRIRSELRLIEPMAHNPVFRLVAKPFRRVLMGGLRSMGTLPIGDSVCVVYERTSLS